MIRPEKRMPDESADRVLLQLVDVSLDFGDGRVVCEGEEEDELK